MTGNRIRTDAKRIISTASSTMITVLCFIRRTNTRIRMPDIVTAVKMMSNIVHISCGRAPGVLPDTISRIPLHRPSVVLATLRLLRTHTPICLFSEKTILEE